MDRLGGEIRNILLSELDSKQLQVAPFLTLLMLVEHSGRAAQFQLWRIRLFGVPRSGPSAVTVYISGDSGSQQSLLSSFLLSNTGLSTGLCTICLLQG